ncbi:MAG: TonB-dependent receptor [Bacteroidota bacterium]
MIRAIAVSIGVLLCSMTTLFAQHTTTGRLTGTVTDTQGEALPGISVMLKGASRGVATEVDGGYTLKNLKSGQYDIVISGVGFIRQEVRVSIIGGKVIQQNVMLQEDTQQLEEVVIQAESEGQVLRLSAKSVQVIETREVKLKSADLGEVLAQTEGVNVQRAGGLGSNTRFALNGLSDDQIRFFYDGIPLNFTPYTFGIANIPVNMIERVEIYKGVVPIEFGADALGGAVNLASPPVYDGLTGSASYQVGSFNTHRATANINYTNKQTGLFVVAGGFFDDTDNNYKIDVAVSETREDGSFTGRLKQETVRRFHDGYQAYGANLRVGIREKKWANELSLEGYYGDYDNEIQNSQAPGLIDEPSVGINQAVAGNPFGEVRFISFSKGGNLRHNVNLYENWELDLTAGYNYNERTSIDTSRNQYSWFGEIIREKIVPGEFGAADHLITISESAFARQQLTYTLSDKHALKLSVAPTYAYRTGDDLLIDGALDPALDDSYLFDLVTGLEYTTELLDKRFQNTTFVKNYHQSVRIESFAPNVEETLIDQRSVSNFGAGSGLRYDWSPRFSIKFSYEYAYRLPRQYEIFGDGLLIRENLELRPESSHNVNLQWSFSNRDVPKTEWQVQGNFFLRSIDDLIFLLISTGTGPLDLGAYENVWSATSQGLELSGRLKGLIPGLTLSGNTTYQQYLNTSDSGPFASFEGDRIPNTPYFFANGSAEYRLPDVLQQDDDLTFFWNTRFVQSFFIGWESAGLQQFKAEVPSQTVHSAGLTHRMNIKKVQSALTLEVQNLTNAKVFDLFGVQRPGRAFYIKSTVQF